MNWYILQLRFYLKMFFNFNLSTMCRHEEGAPGGAANQPSAKAEEGAAFTNRKT